MTATARSTWRPSIWRMVGARGREMSPGWSAAQLSARWCMKDLPVSRGAAPIGDVPFTMRDGTGLNRLWNHYAMPDGPAGNGRGRCGNVRRAYRLHWWNDYGG